MVCSEVVVVVIDDDDVDVAFNKVAGPISERNSGQVRISRDIDFPSKDNDEDIGGTTLNIF